MAYFTVLLISVMFKVKRRRRFTIFFRYANILQLELKILSIKYIYKKHLK